MQARKKLILADLAVETFVPSDQDGRLRGTVHANQTSAAPPCEPTCGSCYTGAPTCAAVQTCFQTEPCFPTCNGAEACNTGTCSISRSFSCGATCACDCMT